MRTTSQETLDRRKTTRTMSTSDADNRTPSFIDDDRPILLAQLREATKTASPVSDVLADPNLLRALTRPSTPRKGSSKSRSKMHKSSQSELPPELPLLTIVLNEEERQSNQLKMLLHSTTDRLEHEMQRADAAERRTGYAEAKVKQASERIAKITLAHHQMELTVTRVTEEAKMYKMMYQGLQAEIERAHANIDDLEDKKRRAEDEARRARDVISQYERLCSEREAREIGRQEGMKQNEQRYVEGVVEGRKEGFEAAKRIERTRRKRLYATAFEAGRTEGFDEGSAQGRASERQNALEAFDKFLENEGYSDE